MAKRKASDNADGRPSKARKHMGSGASPQEEPGRPLLSVDATKYTSRLAEGGSYEQRPTDPYEQQQQEDQPKSENLDLKGRRWLRLLIVLCEHRRVYRNKRRGATALDAKIRRTQTNAKLLDEQRESTAIAELLKRRLDSCSSARRSLRASYGK